MTKKDYADILKWAIQLQIDYVHEELANGNGDENYLSGIVTGLQIALDKIEASMFVINK